MTNTAPDFARIKRNIGRMIEQSAPEADIDAYVQSEGIAPDQLRGSAPPAPTNSPAAAQASPVASSDPMGGFTGGMEPDAPPAAPMLYGKQMANVAGSLGRGADNLVRVAANGMTFGLADKVAAGGRALTGDAPSYDDALKQERSRTEQVRTDYPGAAVAADLAGSLATGAGLMRNGVTLANAARGAMLPVRAGAFGLEGAAYGAANAAGHTDSGNVADYAGNAWQGAKTGAAIGAALPVAGSVLGGLYRLGSPFLNRTSPGLSRTASGVLDTAAGADREGLRNLGGQLGDEAVLGDAGPSLLGLTQGVATKPGAGRSAVVDALSTRDAGRNARLAQDVTETLGPAQSPVAMTRTLLDARREITRPLYAQAFKEPPEVDTSYVLGQIDARLRKAEGAEKAALQKAREMIMDAPAAAGEAALPKVDAERLHNIKGELDNLIQYGDPGLGVPAGSLNREQGALRQVRGYLNDALETQVPGYKAANAKSREYARLAETVEQGGDVLAGGKTALWPQDLAEKWAKLTPAEQDALRVGVRGDIENAVGTQANDLAALKKKLGGEDDWNRLKMAIVYGDEATGKVAGAVDREQRFARTYGDVARNSQTAQRTASSALLDSASVPDIPVNLTMSGIAARGAQEVAKGVMRTVSGSRSDAVREELGRVLTMRGPERDRLIEALLNASDRRAATAGRLRSAPVNPALLNALTGSGRSAEGPR